MLPFFSGIENRYLESWDTFFGVLVAPGVAAQTGSVRIVNPAGSNVIAVVQSVKISKLSAGTLNGNFGRGAGTAVNLGTAATGMNPDIRGRVNSTSVLSQGTGVLALPINWASFTFGVAAAFDLELINNENQEWILTPGCAYELVNQTVNEAMHVNWIWRERFLEDSERA